MVIFSSVFRRKKNEPKWVGYLLPTPLLSLVLNMMDPTQYFSLLGVLDLGHV